LSAMYSILVLLPCLACVGHGRRVQASGDRFANLQLSDRIEAQHGKALPAFRIPAAAFSPSGLGPSAFLRRSRHGHSVPIMYVGDERGTPSAPALDSQADLGSAQPVVFDNVFSTSACRYLHVGSDVGELGYEEHTLFRRDAPPRTALETCIDSVLKELGDNSRYVEYWWRGTWEHVKAHEDVDEDLFERNETQRHYPTHAHVLYLKVGTAVHGPTCVWGHTDDAGEDSDFGPMTVVPARDGRLLRFSGKSMHTVPCPADVFLPAEWRRPPQEVTSKHDLVRSVLLFNTWDEPPSNVPGAGKLVDPHKRVASLAGDFSSPSIDALVEAMANPDAECQSCDEWLRAPERRITSSETIRADDGTPVPMRVELLGEAERRKRRERVLELDAPAGLSEALHEREVVTYFGN